MRFGDVDTKQIIDNEFTGRFLIGVIDYILDKNPSIRKPSKADFDVIKQAVVKELRKKYPNTSIDY